MIEATTNLTSNRPVAPTPHLVRRCAQTAAIGRSMVSLLDVTDELRRQLEERGDDADQILAPLDKGITATWESL